jgi:hypothetical protein
MNERIPGDGDVTTRGLMAILALFLLVFGALFYLTFVGGLCFDYCGTAEEYANRALVAGAITIGPGALATFVSFGLLLRSLRQTGHERAFGFASVSMIALLVAAGLYLWSGAPWIGQLIGSGTQSMYDPVTRARPERAIHVAIAFGVVSVLLAWPFSVSRAPLWRTRGDRDAAV